MGYIANDSEYPERDNERFDMGTLYVCAVYDRAAEGFMRPFYQASEGLAVRLFTDEVNRKADENPMSRYPRDFELWLLSMYEEATGEFEKNFTKRKLVDAVTVLVE